MRYLLLVVLFASGLGAQYQIGFQNDGIEDVVTLSINEGPWTTGNLLTGNLPVGSGYVYHGLPGGDYTVAATTGSGLTYLRDMHIPSGVMGSVLVPLSSFTTVIGPVQYRLARRVRRKRMIPAA